MLTFHGTVKGVKRFEKTNKQTGEVYHEYFLGLANTKQGGYDGEENIRDIKLTKKQLQNNLDTYYKDLVGKRVQVEVFMNHRAWKERVYSDWFLGGEGRPISIDGKPAPAVKAA